MENQRARRFLPDDDTSTASWNESLHINRGKEFVADKLQNVVRHHRKDNDEDDVIKRFPAEPADEQQFEEPPARIDISEEVQKREGT